MKDTETDSLSIVVLLHRDAMTLREIAGRCVSLRQQVPELREILLVNSASPDKCGEISKELAAEFPDLIRSIDITTPGYGLAVKTGLNAASSEWVTIIDGDLEYRVEDIPLLFSRRAEQNVILSFRYVKRYSTIRRFISFVFNTVIRMRFGIDFRDVGSGLRIYSRTALEGFDFRSNSSFMSAEIPIKLILSGYTLTEVGIHSYPSPYRSTGIVRPRQILRVISDMNSCHNELFPSRRNRVTS